MYHFPIRAGFEQQHEVQLRQRSASMIEDLLKDAELHIGSNVHQRSMLRYGVVKLDNVSQAFSSNKRA